MAKMTQAQKKAYGKQKSEEMSDRWFNAIAEGIKANNIVWRKPWKGGGLPRNMKSKRAYKGGNLIGLMFHAMANGWTDLRFGTRNQLKDAGMSLSGLKNGTGIPIRYFKQSKYEKEDEKGEVTIRTGYLTRWYEVWCVEQCEDYRAPESDSHQSVPEHEMMKYFDNYIENEESLTLVRGGDRAFYRPSTDEIQLPPHSAFTDSLGEVATAFHEVAHSTGHPNRTERPLNNKFGSPQYALEELVAEIASMFVIVQLGGEFSPDNIMEENANSLSYLDHWVQMCEDKDKALTKAFSQAQQACDYILSQCTKEE